MKISSGNFKAYFALGCVSFFWGTTYIAIRYGVLSAPPLFYAGLRQLLAGLLLCSWFWVKGEKLPGPKDMKVILISSIFMIVIGNGCVTWASRYVTSGLAALICSLTPIWIMAINRIRNPTGAVNPKATLGILLGAAGMMVIFADNINDFSNTEYLAGIIAIMAACMSWAMGTDYISRNQTRTNPLYGAALQMTIAGSILLLISVPKENPSFEFFNTNITLTLAYLVIFGSVVAYGSYVYALSKLPTSVVSIYAYINTIVAVFLGWLIMEETITISLLIGAAITITGVYLVNSGYRQAREKKLQKT